MTRSWTLATRFVSLTLLLCSATAALGYDGEGAQEPRRAWASGLSPGESGPIPLSLREDAAQFAHTSRFLFRRLFSASSRAATFWTLGSILGASAVLEHNKYDLQEDLLAGTSEESNEWSMRTKKLGDPGIVPGLGLLLLLEGLAFRQPRVHDTGLMILESALYTGLFTEAGQFVLSEQRPDRGGDLSFFQGGGHGVSGHAAIAASIAAPLSRGLFRVEANDGGWKRFGKRLGTGLAYGLPVLTGLSRIEDNRHYAWNVGLGLALGFAVGDTVADAHDSRRGGEGPRWAPDSMGPLVT
ncbi:MAG: phosphatase PAP2 family protein, partial [Anaerolineales bacterium]